MSPLPTLVFAWGNPSRGDDALGPLFLEAVDAMALPGVECLTDFQLQVEHVLDLVGRTRVLFVDASADPALAAGDGFSVDRLHAARDGSVSSHSVSPQALLHAFQTVECHPPPDCWLLAVGGVHWGLGDAVSECARRNLDAALAWAVPWLRAN